LIEFGDEYTEPRFAQTNYGRGKHPSNSDDPNSKDVCQDTETDIYLSVASSLLGDLPMDRVMTREGQLQHGDTMVWVQNALMDTGADRANYCGGKLAEQFPDAVREPCRHPVRLGDGKTIVMCTETITLDTSIYAPDGTLIEPISTTFHIMPQLGERIIIGLPDILGNFYEVFKLVLEDARLRMPQVRIARLHQLSYLSQIERAKQTPNKKLLKSYGNEARSIGSWYSKLKYRVTHDPQVIRTLATLDGLTYETAISERFGQVLMGDNIENLCLSIENLQDHPADTVLDAWSKPPEECPEESETPDPLAFGPDVLYFMETSVEEARSEYLDLIHKQVTPEMLAAQPRVVDILKSASALKTFAPETWDGLKIPPVTLDVVGDLPKSMLTRARPIRTELLQHAKKEFDRLSQYFYESDPRKCTSPITSPLVIAPKATAPFIRFCGDYRRVNEFISIPHHPIPIVTHALSKASQFKVFVDLDMTNSFHQIPLSEAASHLLSVQTPWGVVRPKFLPEGVGPASGMLQSIVTEIFKDFEEWTIVIFDNFLVLADSYEDAANKLERVIARCAEYGVVLKMKKSFIGASKVTFFGYEVTHGHWQLSQSRKDSIQAMPFPKSKKEMQSFLGAALFFHNHIPDYSEWSAKLYETTHDKFSWDPTTWTYDYKAHFQRFKDCIESATELYFPRYDLPWVVRCDASEHAVGAILFQVYTDPDGIVTNQPIAFSSKRFSEPAQKWDAYKREAYAIYHAVESFAWYLRGKEFLVETDHRNLQWIETSNSPIVCRWRALLQCFDFKIKHIPGRENRVADWLSRPDANSTETRPGNTMSQTQAQVLSQNQTMTGQILATINNEQEVERSLDSILQEVHGVRNMHFGIHRTWHEAKMLYPKSTITLRAVAEWVKNCPLCQKTRRTGITGLPARTLSLKPESYRKTVGIDHVTVTPEDKHGNKCAIMIVEHFSHYPFVYAAKDYTAETAAGALFKHYCHQGTFEQLASDPGSAFMSEIFEQLNTWLGTRHKVSLVGRHESNGCEGSNKQFLRHLKTLVMDTRLYDNWSDDAILPLINLHLASYPTEETGGYTPHQLKYGTEDARYFILPDQLQLEPGVQAHLKLKQLDANLQHIRKLSLQFQTTLAQERASKDKSTPSYEPGDLIFFNPREHPTDHLETKLSPDWLGPYEVVEQTKNDISVRHVVLNTPHEFHVDRVKPFIGSYEQALEIARHDQHQFFIVSFNFFTGNPFKRTTMVFNITFEDGTIDLPYGGDFIYSEQFRDYINETPELYPLRYTATISTRNIGNIEKLAITEFQPGMEAYVNIRIYDGKSSQWFDSLKLPKKKYPYVVAIKFSKWYRNNHRIIEAVVPLFGPTHDKYTLYLTAYDLQAYIIPGYFYWGFQLLEERHLIRYPQILSS